MSSKSGFPLDVQQESNWFRRIIVGEFDESVVEDGWSNDAPAMASHHTTEDRELISDLWFTVSSDAKPARAADQCLEDAALNVSAKSLPATVEFVPGLPLLWIAKAVTSAHEYSTGEHALGVFGR